MLLLTKASLVNIWLFCWKIWETWHQPAPAPQGWCPPGRARLQPLGRTRPSAPRRRQSRTPGHWCIKRRFWIWVHIIVNSNSSNGFFHHEIMEDNWMDDTCISAKVKHTSKLYSWENTCKVTKWFKVLKFWLISYKVRFSSGVVKDHNLYWC